jgi:hypothetical protein
MNYQQILGQGEGILRLAPAWVPRDFCIPGRRMKLHPDDIYAFGANRGGIDERWLASTAKADNGPLTRPDEGMSYVIFGEQGKLQKALFADFVADLGAALVGEEIWKAHHGWPMFSKFFDNKGALPFHLHQMEEHANKVNAQPKPESYYFPRQLNNYGADFPYTFLGLETSTSKTDIRHCLEIWNQGDNRITDFSRAYRLKVGTGWYVPAGVLHAPGSMLTYEPQWASDVFSMLQSVVNEVPIPWSMVTKNVPEDKHHDLDYIISMIDWEINTDPKFKEKYFRLPKPVKPEKEMQQEGYTEYWISYGAPYFGAKELTVLPGKTVTIKDPGAYGLIMLQGHGKLGVWDIETPVFIRFDQFTQDEYFVSAAAAKNGVKISNLSKSDPIVMLKHFGPNPESGKVSG